MKNRAKQIYNTTVFIALLCIGIVSMPFILIIAAFKTHGSEFIIQSFTAYLKVIDRVLFDPPSAPVKKCETCGGFGRLWQCKINDINDGHYIICVICKGKGKR